MVCSRWGVPFACAVNLFYREGFLFNRPSKTKRRHEESQISQGISGLQARLLKLLKRLGFIG